MSRLRMLCERYIHIDDDLNKLKYEMDNLDSNHQKSELIARYIKKFVEREDFKSGMRRYLVNELLQGVGVNENEKKKYKDIWDVEPVTEKHS